MSAKTKAIALPEESAIAEVIHMIIQEAFDDQTVMQSEFEKYVDQPPDPAPPEIEMKDFVCDKSLQA